MYNTVHAQHTRNEFYCTLSIRGTNFIAFWTYVKLISSHAEHARKCLKVEYLNFQKSRVTGPWDHMVLVSAKKVQKKFHACVPLKLVSKSSLWLCYIYTVEHRYICRVAFLNGAKSWFEGFGHTKALLLHYGPKANLSWPLSPRWVDWLITEIPIFLLCSYYIFWAP